MRKGEFQFSSQLTRFETDEQFGGGAFEGNQERTDLYATDSQVEEGAVTLDMNLGYGLSRQFSLNVGAPLILYSHWSTKLAGTRYNQKIQGIGDVNVGVNYWMMNCERYPDKNISFGLNVRVPTGESNYQVLYPNSQGQDFRMRPAFPGTQPGSDAWALRPVIEAFHSFEHFTVYGTATYQFSLRAHNDTNPLGATLNPAGLNATRPELRYISTPDSYLISVGIGAPVPKLTGTSAFLNWRAVGVPVHNVFGPTTGYRQPGYYTTIEPGIGWSTSLASYTFSVPLRLWASTNNNFLDQRISSDFTRYSIVAGVTFKFGGKGEPAPDVGATGPEARSFPSIHGEAHDKFKPFKLKTLDGTQKTLADFANKATLVTFFFPTCVYCNAAFPEVQKIYDQHKDHGLSMVWINVVPEENGLIADWQAKHQYTVPVLVAASQESLQRDYQLKMTPTHYLLDAEGHVLFSHAGYEKGDEKELEGKIEKALNIAP